MMSAQLVSHKFRSHRLMQPARLFAVSNLLPLNPRIVTTFISSSSCRGIVTSALPPITVPHSSYVSELHQASQRFPDRKAIIDGISNYSYTYSELRRATLNVGSGLTKLGFARGSVLAVVTHNRPEFIFASHGAIAAGGTASPLNCYSTASELTHPLVLSNASVVVTDRERLSVVRESLQNCSTLPRIFLIGESKQSANELGCSSFDLLLNDNASALSESFADVDAEEDIAFLPFSSGTTGLPKGVMLSHNNVTSNLRQQKLTLRNPEAEEVSVGVLPFYHIYALNTVIGNTLHTGGTLVTLPRFRPEAFLSAIETYKISVCHLVPPLLLFLLQSPLVDQYRLSSILRVMSGAAPLGIDVEKQVDDKVSSMNPLAHFFQGYGLTETSPFSHANVQLTEIERKNKRLGSIGRPVAGLECKIVDPDTRCELEPGETGELAMRGPNIMKGYLKQPEETAKCIDSDGWFFSGDVGRYDNDGYFYITDRIKELIKYKGLQVAPAELESVLLTHPKVRDCAVIGKKDDKAGELPMAFVVRENDDLETKEIHDHFALLLSDHKQLRGGIQFVSEIPKSPSGKILRRKLRDSI